MSLPLVSIGVPVYNEEAFLTESLESLVAQNYGNIEIIIFNNASTDKTTGICNQFSNKFSHIEHHLLESNIGAAANFRAVQKQASGKYFMWAAGHDIWSNDLISECVTTLEKDDTAVIAFATSQWIDGTSNTTDIVDSGWIDTRGMHAIARFNCVIWGNMHPILGLIRNNDLNQCKDFQSILGADLVMLSELSLRGDFVHATKPLWSRRIFRENETYKDRLKRYKSKEYMQISQKRSLLPPILTLPIELIKVLFRSSQKKTVKCLALFALLPTMTLKYFISK